MKVHLRLSLSSRRSASADQPTQSLTEVGEHLLYICHTVDRDAGQVGNCGEEKLADVFLVISDRSEHNGLVKVDREKQENLYEASSLPRKSTPFPEPALESRVARYSTQALIQQQENEIKLRMHRLTLCQQLIQSWLSPFPTCKGKKETNSSAFTLFM